MLGAIFKKRQPSVGARPGTLVISENAKAPKVHVTKYNENEIEEFALSDLDKITEFLNSKEKDLYLFDVQGLGDEKVLRKIASIFGIHPLTLEDIVNTPQRPKKELYGNYLLLISRRIRMLKNEGVQAEQITLLLGNNYVLSFQEAEEDILAPIRERIRDGKGFIRKSTASYLAYAILDTVVDSYYPIVGMLSEKIVFLEDRVITRSSKNTRSNQPGQIQFASGAKRDFSTSGYAQQHFEKPQYVYFG